MQYLFMAFGVVWLLVTIYLLFLVAQQRKLETELDSLKETIEQKTRN
jgi:CcmD family protein